MKLTNDEKRREFLANWQEWVVWGECAPLGLTVRRVILPNGTYISAAEYDEVNRTHNGSRQAVLNSGKHGEGFSHRSLLISQISERLKDLKEQLRKNKTSECMVKLMFRHAKQE